MFRKKMLICLASLACTLFAGVGIHMVNKQVNAQMVMSEFTISQSAVRTDDPSGLRFKVDCPVQEADAENAYTRLTFTAADGERYFTTVPATVWRTDNSGWNTVLLGIPESDYATEISAQSFVTVGGIQYQTAVETTSIAKTASKAMDGSANDALVSHYVQGQVSNITVQTTSATLEQGQTLTLQATTQPSGFGVLFTSSNTSVATVDKTGTITAQSAGTATITISMGGKTATCVVTVQAAQAQVAEMNIYFPQLGNTISGDCTIIKVGNTEVLIDAGSKRGSAETLVPYIKQYCTDGILEYVIATHAHEDHIAAFVGDDGTDGVFANFECKTIIDFPKKKTTSGISKDYITWRDKEVAAGAVHYTALQCYNNANGAKRTYELGEGITLNILYQKYYEQSGDENNYSVCTLISQGDNHYLFTGDLESAGEASLVASNNLPKCAFYKAGHHGSNTSSTSTLIDVIQPEVVVSTCCCGDTHGFPHQEFINNIAPYTDALYIPSYRDSSNTSKFVLLNGNITVNCKDGKNITVTGSNNNLKFKDTDWFKNNRTLPTAWKTS